MIFGIENQSLKEQLDEFHKDLPEGISEEKRRIGAFPHLGKYAAAAAAILLAIALLWCIVCLKTSVCTRNILRQILVYQRDE
ncbi:hypothetical protein [Psychroserpens sp. Hel_I_66]|uniref:hypothetical protein n=1 Tax=Psychroserpens sp. Hel_I_66 TaxID=1250004 RepID=UPI0006466E8F|nr:hypothetical protein [Psychroserpens sp. Hel_I_66]